MNGFGPDEAKVLSDALGCNISLRQLNLRRNPLTHVGAERLATSLRTNSTLTHLLLSGAFNVTSLARHGGLLVCFRMQHWRSWHA